MAVAYLVLPILVFITNIFLIGLVLRSEWRSYIHRVFAAFLLSMALWGFLVFGMRSSPDLRVAYQWEKWLLAALPFVSITFYHFSLVFTGNRGRRRLLGAFYLMGLVVGVLSLTGFTATEMQRKFYGYAPVLGLGFGLFLVIAYAPSFSALVLLIRARRRSHSGEERSRLTLVVVGAALSLLGGTVDYLPALGVKVHPMGIVASLFYGVLTTIAITRFRLMDLRLALRRGFAYSLVSSVVLGVYGGTFLVFWAVFRERTTTATVVATVAALLLVAVFLPPYLARIQQFVDRLFFRERYDHLMALQRFTLETHDIADFEGLASSLTKTVTLAMQADWVVTLLPDESGKSFVTRGDTRPAGSPDMTVSGKSLLVNWLARAEAVPSIEELDQDAYLQGMNNAERRQFTAASARLFVPMKSKGQLTGILVLGPRITDADYSREDKRLLSTVASQAATLVENSRLYAQEMERLHELEQLEHLKSNLLRTVAHELKSPVTAVKAAVDLLTDSPEGFGERNQARLLRALRSGVDRLERLVEESLDYAQMQSAQLELRRELVDYGKIVEEAIGMVAPTIRSRQQNLNVELTPGLPKLLVDPSRIERVVLNLLSNANKFTPLKGDIAVRVWREDGKVLTRVSDNGPGIPEEDLQYLFNEYFRGTRADGRRDAGTGLGLSIAKYLVERHGGSIGVQSVEGQGATFTFALPVPSDNELEGHVYDMAVEKNGGKPFPLRKAL